MIKKNQNVPASQMEKDDRSHAVAGSTEGTLSFDSGLVKHNSFLENESIDTSHLQKLQELYLEAPLAPQSNLSFQTHNAKKRKRDEFEGTRQEH